jgi:WD40 repeat protein
MNTHPENPTGNGDHITNESKAFEHALRKTADGIHPRAAFTAELRASLREAQTGQRAHGFQVWARPLLRQGAFAALLAALVLMAVLLTPQIAPSLRHGPGLPGANTAAPGQPRPEHPDALPNGALARLGRGVILTMDTAADGRTVIGSTLGVCLYNAGRSLDWCIPTGTAYGIHATLFNPAGDRLAVAITYPAALGSLMVLDAASGEVLSSYPFPTGYSGRFMADSAVAWDPSGQPRLALPADPSSLLVWDWQTDSVVWGPLDIRQTLSEEGIFALDWALDPQGASRLAAGGRAGLLLLDGATGQELLRLGPTTQHTPIGNITALDLSPDGRWLAFDHTEGVAALRFDGDILAGRAFWRFYWQPNQIAFAPDSTHLAVQNKDSVRILSVADEAAAQDLPAGYGPLAWDAQGSLFYARPDGMWGSWTNGVESVIPSEHTVWPGVIAWNAGGKDAGGKDGGGTAGGIADEIRAFRNDVITQWSLAPATALSSVSQVAARAPILLAIAPDGARAAYYLNGEAAILLWDASANQPAARLENTPRILHAAFSADSARLITMAQIGELTVWDTASGQPVRSMEVAPDNSQIDALAIAPSGLLGAVSGYKEGQLYLDIWDLERAEIIASPAIDVNIRPLAFSPDGRNLAGADGAFIRLWDTTSGERTGKMGPEPYAMASDIAWRGPNSNPGGFIQSLAWSPDGKTLASGGGLVTVWDVASRLPVMAFGGHRERANAVAFRPDGLALASASIDGTILIWSLGAGPLPHVVLPTATPAPAGGSPAGGPIPLSDGEAAGYTLWKFLSALANGRDDADAYAQAAQFYGGELTLPEGAQIRSFDDSPTLLRYACEAAGYLCQPPLKVMSAGERDGFLFMVVYSDGAGGELRVDGQSGFTFRVERGAGGEYQVMTLPPLATP